MPEAVLLAFALLASLCGMGWLALAMDVHWAQVSGDAPARRHAPRRLRAAGGLALAASLALCLAADHASIAVLVWIMSLVAATLAVAFLLAVRPGWLAWLAGPRAKAPRPGAADASS